jgi:hypothetical protein
MNHTPDQVKQSIVHVLDEWAEAVPVTNEMSAFARSDWLSKSDRIGQGFTMHTTTTDLVSDLQRRQRIARVCKE